MRESKQRGLRSGWRIGLIALGVTLWSCSAVWADVTIKETSKTKGLGGFMDAETKTVTCIKGDKKCEDSEVKMTNKLMKMMGGGKPIKSTSITRLDRDPGVIITVDHRSKTYSEMPLSTMDGLADAFGQAGMDGESTESEMGIDTSEVRMSPPTFKVEKTGKTEKIAGYQCEQTILTVEMEGERRDTGEKFKLIIDMDMMLAKDVEGIDELSAFEEKMAEAMGFDADEMPGESMMGMMGAYGVDPEVIRKEASKLEGYPLRQTMVLRSEGEAFEAMMAQGGADGDDGDMQDLEEATAMAGKMLGGLFGKKKDKDEDNDKNDPKVIMEVTTTVTKISTKSISDDKFEPPAGYDGQSWQGDAGE